MQNATSRGCDYAINTLLTRINKSELFYADCRGLERHRRPVFSEPAAVGLFFVFEEIMMEIKSLTGVRGVAALMVFFYHAQLIIAVGRPGTPNYVPFLNQFWIGVDLFFILSGFVLMLAHSSDLADLGMRTSNSFWNKRIWRIYPVNTAVLVILVILYVIDPGYYSSAQNRSAESVSATAFLRTAALGTVWLPLKGNWNGPTWSVSAEVVGYMAFPLLAYILIRSSRKANLIVAFVTMCVFASLAVAKHRVGVNVFSPAWALLRMFSGLVIGASLQRAATFAEPLLARYAQVTSTVAVILIFGSCVDHRAMIFSQVAFALLLMSIMHEESWASRLLASKPAVFMGRISYPFYLLHLIPLAAIIYHLQGDHMSEVWIWALVLLYCAACVGLSFWIHRFIEKPMRRFGRTEGSGRQMGRHEPGRA